MNRKKLKTTMSCIVAMLVSVCLSVPTYAATNFDKSDIERRYQTVCGSFATHYMQSRGVSTVTLASGEVYILGGSCWQCARCHLVLATEGDYYWDGSKRVMEPIGKWATYSYTQQIPSQGTQIYIPSSYGYTSHGYLNGYTFYSSDGYISPGA